MQNNVIYNSDEKKNKLWQLKIIQKYKAFYRRFKFYK